MARYIIAEDAIPYLTRYIPSVEAVKREKIDKAIEEIIKYRDDATNDFCEFEVGAINGALEILKRNIGA